MIVVLDCAVSHHELRRCQTPVPTDLIIDTGSASRSVKADGVQGGFGGIEIHKSTAQVHVETGPCVKTLQLRNTSTNGEERPILVTAW